MEPNRGRFGLTIVAVVVAAGLIVGGIVASIALGDVEDGPPNGGVVSVSSSP